MCLRVGMFTLQLPKEARGVALPGAEVIGGCGLPDVGSGN